MNETSTKILVFIACYMDNELEATVAELIGKCSDASRLDVIIMNQDDETRTSDRFPANVSLINIHFSKSRGLTWARSFLNSYLEPVHGYVLNIDSHSRFDIDWDRILTAAVDNYPGRAVISAFPGQYFVTNSVRTNGNVINHIVAVNPDYSMHIGSMSWNPDSDGYIRYGIIAGGFNFSHRQFWEDVPVDPHAAWNWEQGDVTVRAFTFGYDVVNIPSPPIYHLYTHENRKICGPTTWKYRLDSSERFVSKLQSRNATFLERRYAIGIERTVAEFESVHSISLLDRRKQDIVSIPVAVHSDLFAWQLSLFWFSHRLTYGHSSSQKAIAAVAERNYSHELPVAKMTWDLTIPHRMVRPYFEYLPEVQSYGMGVPLNIQTGVAQVLSDLDGSQVVEILDCDMCHIRPAPFVLPQGDELIVSDIYEVWHLKSHSDHKDIVQKRTEGRSDYYNGGFVPIIGRVDTLRRILPVWIEAHLEILTDPSVPQLQQWWGGMYALQVACEKLHIRMIARDCLYVPGINTLSSNHYVAHYSCDPRFDKKKFPSVRIEDFENNAFYDRVKYWLDVEWRR